jgi:hypothetical protein
LDHVTDKSVKKIVDFGGAMGTVGVDDGNDMAAGVGLD